MSPALGTNGGRSKSTTVFIHLCIACNGKSLKFDTVAKIKVTSVLEIFMSLKYVMYIHIIGEKKIKTGGHRSYKKMGAVPKVRIGDKTLFLSRSRTFKKSLQDMIVSLTQAMHLYMVCKSMTENMASALI